MKLQFLGATGTVTGSKYLLEANGRKFLVDCGLFQGLKELRLRNWAALPIDPKQIDAVILTHAHIDHTGYIPRLVNNGFTGPIYCSEGTRDLCEIMLPDSGHLHEEDTKRANKYGYSKHHPALPLYTKQDAIDSLRQFKVKPFGEAFTLFDDVDVSCTFSHSGHIIGSAFVTLQFENKQLLFSGDIGRLDDPIMSPPVHIEHADFLVLESTYGNRRHDPEKPDVQLERIINKTIEHGGTVLIPSFAVGRAQSMLYYIHQLKQEHRIADIPVFLDSPMSIDATNLMCKHHKEHRLSKTQAEAVCRTATYVNTPEESKRIDNMKMPKIIISASGMATGGRVLHHLKAFVKQPENTVIFGGFQAAGTRGARMVAGETTVKIHGNIFPVNARIEQMNNLSAHGDYEEILQWLGHFRKAPVTTYITHGEPEAAQAMKAHIEERYGWHVVVPEYLQSVEL